MTPIERADDPRDPASIPDPRGQCLADAARDAPLILKRVGAKPPVPVAAFQSSI